MRCLILMTIFPALLAAIDLHIDHVTVAGANLQQMQAALTAIGIPSVYGGAHSTGATEMALVSFPDGSYLELIALRAGAPPAAVDQNPWARHLRGNAGPTAWAVRLDDLAGEVHRLKSAGIPVSLPERSGRQRPDGVHLEWETSSVGTEPRGTFFPFLIHDFTPRDQRAFPQGKPLTQSFRGISRIVIAVHDLAASIQRYRKAYDLPAPLKLVDKEFAAQLAIFPSTPVVLAQPLGAGSWLNQRLADFGEAPCAFVLAAARPGKFRIPSRSQWLTREISWFDAQKLGWRLGFESAP